MERYFNDEWNLIKPPTEGEIRRVVEEVFKNLPVQEERKMKFFRYCLSIGGLRSIDTSEPFLNICHNEKCINCREMENIFQEELKQYLNDSKKENL